MVVKNEVRQNGRILVPEGPEEKFTVFKDRRSLDGVLVTPEMARFILRHHNRKNRNVRESTVEKYVGEMRNNRWDEENGERITFDWNGDLISGQHRLISLVRAGVSLRFDFKFGLNPERSRETTDTGSSRSAADVVALITGDKNATVKTKIVNGIRKILSPHRTAFSGALAIAMIEDYRRGIDVVSKIIGTKNVWGRGPASAAFALAATAHPVKTKDLLTALVEGNVGDSSAAQALNRYAQTNFGDDTEDMISTKILYGIYKHFHGEPVERLQGAKAGWKDQVLEFFLKNVKSDLTTLAEVSPKRV